MMPTFDLYEILELSRGSTTAEIQQQLLVLRAKWENQYQSGRKKLAEEKLFYIGRAEEAFADEDSRAAYDKELAFSTMTPGAGGGGGAAEAAGAGGAEGGQNADFARWYADAGKYYDSNQYDLAQSAIEEALGALGGGSRDPQVHVLAAGIYHKRNNIARALEHINKAILFDPGNASNDFWKYIIIRSDRSANRDDWMGALQVCADKAQKKNDTALLSKAYGFFAKEYGEAGNSTQAEDYAVRALKLDPNNTMAKEYCDKYELLRKRAERSAQVQAQEAARAAEKRAQEAARATERQARNAAIEQQAAALRATLPKNMQAQLLNNQKVGTSSGCAIAITIVCLIGFCVFALGAFASAFPDTMDSQNFTQGELSMVLYGSLIMMALLIIQPIVMLRKALKNKSRMRIIQQIEALNQERENYHD